MANLFIGSLAYATTDDTLKAFFETVGPVKDARVITDRDSGRSKGFGFVEYEDDELNGKELDGRAIAVSVARPKEERPRDGGFRNNAGNGNAFRQRSW